MDEIGDIAVNTQAKFLRVAESGEIRRVGDNKVINVDTRIIAATHKDLATEAKSGKFREDLYFRLNVITLSLPPLRDRREDIPVLIDHFLDNFCKNRQKKILLQEAMTVMTQYNWPGNVRELKNTIERLVVMTEGNSLSIEDLPENIRMATSTTDEGTEVILSGVEKKHILKVLHEKQGNKTLDAEALGISLKTLYNKLKAYNIEL